MIYWSFKEIIFLVVEFTSATLFYTVLLFINNVFNSLGITNNYSSNRAHNDNDFKQCYLFSSTKRPVIGWQSTKFDVIYIIYIKCVRSY